ncbi:hypothetical protein [Streptomyces sedi]|uniref:Uncharacterized protein n=1 Tax=Streptomyces sedi TaxID=555059 RepID=A0A5C4V902_9ACTN|nr:hypothetical protein [Streptomyces sedi]TNM32095.1 hypothetical protein FH715_06720 [Streptomyces sedi]
MFEHEAPASITFVKIVESGDISAEADEQIHSIYTKISNLMEGLAGGYYPKRVGEGVQPRKIDRLAVDRYRGVLDKLLQTETRMTSVAWSELDKELGRFLVDDQAVFDVTTLKKNLLVDVTSLLVSRDCLEFYSFDLGEAPRHFDDRELIHSLDPGRYRYRRISDSPHVVTARKRMVARSATLKVLLFSASSVGLSVILIQFLLSGSWVDRLVVAIATAASIVSLILALRRDDR